MEGAGNTEDRNAFDMCQTSITNKKTTIEKGVMKDNERVMNG